MVVILKAKDMTFVKEVAPPSQSISCFDCGGHGAKKILSI